MHGKTAQQIFLSVESLGTILWNHSSTNLSSVAGVSGTVGSSTLKNGCRSPSIDGVVVMESDTTDDNDDLFKAPPIIHPRNVLIDDGNPGLCITSVFVRNRY